MEGYRKNEMEKYQKETQDELDDLYKNGDMVFGDKPYNEMKKEEDKD